MKLTIGQFTLGNGGGHASVQIQGPQPNSALDRPSHFAILVGYTIHRERPVFDADTQIVVDIPSGRRYVRVGFLTEQPVSGSDTSETIGWPAPSDYRVKVAQMIANMIAIAELSDLGDDVPAWHPDPPRWN